ncbi:MAG TPA: L-threonylcarbamoyladenylate synthase [Vicinamibacterales bacterium]|nr:L-threonylcarbamoyladenylate synthase [Vicinamibacterales bacterium]
MIHLRVKPSDFAEADLAPAVAALQRGGVVAFPTETFYGLAVDPRSAAGVAKIFELKRRGPDQRLPLIASDVNQVADHVGMLTPLAARLASRGWPGPLTLIIPASRRLCDAVHLSTGKVAVRVPSDAVARALAARAGHAITSTSANISGDPPAATPEQVLMSFASGIDVLIDTGHTPAGLPSTIVDATGDVPVLVRAGAIPWDRVLEFSR